MTNVPQLFDAIRKRFGLNSDKALAHRLGVGPSAISKARSNLSLSDTLILRMHERLPIPVAEIRALAGQTRFPTNTTITPPPSR